MTVWRGYGREILVLIDREDVRQQYHAMCDAVGIDLLAPPAWSLPSWTSETTERWLADVEKGLDAVQAAAAKPHYFVPLVRQSEKDLVVRSQPLAIYAFHEQLSDALRLRAQIRFDSEKEKEIGSAWQDYLTSIRLFRLVTVNQAWVKILSNRETESLLTPVSDIIHTLPQWTPEQLEQAIKDLEALPPWQDRQTTLTTTQYMLLDSLSVTNDLPGLGGRLGMELPTETQDMLRMVSHVGFDWNLVAKELNREINVYSDLLEKISGSTLETQFDQLRLRPMGEPHRLPTEEELQQFMTDHFNRTGEIPLVASGRSKLIGAMLGHLGTLATGEMYRLQLMEDSRCQALRLALALERFRQEKERYPDSLVELGLPPMTPDMHLQYEKQGLGYRVQNMVFELDVE